MSNGADRRGVDNTHGYRTRSSAGRKDRKRWCKGRVGVEHATVVQYPPNLAGWVTRRPRALCGPSRYVRSGWTCHHVVQCTVCGRIMREFLGADCPQYDAEAVDADGHNGPNELRVEHWPRTWIVVPVDVSPADIISPAAPSATPPGETGDDVEVWFPDGCTCGAATPCRLAALAGSGTDTGELASFRTPT